MESVAKQKYNKFSELYHSVGNQSFLTIVDTVDQLWFERSQDQNVKSQWKLDDSVERSEVYQEKFWGK